MRRNRSMIFRPLLPFIDLRHECYRRIRLGSSVERPVMLPTACSTSAQIKPSKALAIAQAGGRRVHDRRMVFNILVDNTDDQEKHHSLLVVNPGGHGRLKLAPAYDVLPTNSGQGFQEFVSGAHGRDSMLENAMSQGDAFGLLPAEAAAEVVAVVPVVNRWQQHFARVGVSERDIACLAARIDDDALLALRLGFDPARFQSGPVRRKRASPFRRA